MYTLINAHLSHFMVLVVGTVKTHQYQMEKQLARLKYAFTQLVQTDLYQPINICDNVELYYLPTDLTLRAICTALGSVKTKWLQIGIQLGIPRSKLQEFKKEDDPLSAVVEYWLRGNVTESVIPISWESITTALKSEYVGEPGLAQHIRKEYCQQQEGWTHAFTVMWGGISVPQYELCCIVHCDDMDETS